MCSLESGDLMRYRTKSTFSKLTFLLSSLKKKEKV